MVIAVWLIVTIFGRWMSARWRCALWSLVFVRLVLPALPPSPLSVFNLHDNAQPPALKLTPATASDEVITFGVIPDPAAEIEGASSVAPRRTQVLSPSQWLTVAWLAIAGLLILRMTCACAMLTMKLRRLPELRDPRLRELLDGSPLGAVQ